MSEFSLFHWLIVGGIVFALYSIFRRSSSSGPMVCKRCGYTGTGKQITRGSIVIEIILWLCLIVPGLIYSVWRHSSRFNGCPVCGSHEVIPIDSPVGKKIIAENVVSK